MGRCWQYLRRHTGTPAAPSSTRRSPAPICLHEGRRQYASGREGPRQHVRLRRSLHHARQHIGRQQRAQLHGATCGCMTTAQRDTGGTLVYTKVADTHSSTRRWPQYASRRKGLRQHIRLRRLPAPRPTARRSPATRSAARCLVWLHAPRASTQALWQQPLFRVEAHSWVSACSS